MHLGAINYPVSTSGSHLTDSLILMRTNSSKTGHLHVVALNRVRPNTGAAIPMGQGGHVPPIFMKGWDVHGDAPPNILEVISFRQGLFYPVTATSVVCCILIQTLCVVS